MTTEQWARLSSDAFNVALFSYIAAMLASFAYLAFRARRPAHGRDRDRDRRGWSPTACRS